MSTAEDPSPESRPRGGRILVVPVFAVVLLALVTGALTRLAERALGVPPGSRPDPASADRERFRGMSAVELRALPFEEIVRDLPHLADTPPELRREIDRHCATIVDFDAGRDALDARERLVAIGRPAIPRVLSAFLETGDWTGVEGLVNACFVENALRETAGNAIRSPKLNPFARPTSEQVRSVVRHWFVWWYTAGR